MNDLPKRDPLAAFFRETGYYLEWKAAFRVRCARVPGAERSGDAVIGTDILLGPERGVPIPEVDDHVRLRGVSGAPLTLAGTVTAIEESGIRVELRPDPGSRRAFFRMPVRFSLLIDGVDGGPRQMARVEEMSGGGCRILAPQGALELGEFRIAHLRLENEATPMPVGIEILRIDPVPEGDQVACLFVDLKESQRQRILRRLFREYRQLRRPVSPAGPAESP